jgi:phage gp29-like protein
MKKKPDNKTLTTQIVTDNTLGSFLNYMPNPDNIAPGTFSAYDTYREMRSDPRIKSLLNKLKTAALNFPIHITQPEGCPDKVFALVKGFALWNGLHQKLKRVYSGLDYGFSVSELVWRYEGGLYIPDNIITRKPERFVFGRDWKLYLNEMGERKLLDQPYKWLEYHHDTDDENPYGTSVLRCVYWPYMFKKAGYDFWLQATEKFSVKTILAIFKSEGDDKTIADRARLVSEQLLGIASGSAAAVGNVDDIHEIGMSGDLIGFASLVDACDTQISYGLTGQTIATSKTEGGSLALGEVQADLFYEDAKGIALEGQALIQKVINWAVELNGYAGTVPPLAEVDTERKASFDQVMKAINHGIAVSQDALYDRYGLPRPRDEEDAFKRETPSGFALSDSGRPTFGKKKAPTPRPLIRIM